MELTERETRAFDMAATQARHYPPGHARYWGKNIYGRWTGAISQVAEYG